MATVHASINLVREMQFNATAPNKHSLTLDTGSDAGGHASGLEPLDLVLLSLGGCMAMDVISIMRKKRQDVTHYEVQLTATQTDDHPRVYQRIELDHIFAGRQLDAQAVARAIQLSEDKYCPVSAMLKGTVEIVNKYRIVEDDEHALK